MAEAIWVPPDVAVNHPLNEYPVLVAVGKVQTAALYVTTREASDGVQEFPFHVTENRLGAEQESAVAGAFEQVQLNALAVEVTAEAVPTEQRFAVGGSVVATASDVPHAGFCAHWA